MSPTPFRVGASGSERKIVNLASGTLASGSTDAVNGGQLFTTNANVSALTNGTAGIVRQDPASPFGITVGALTGGTTVDFTGTAGNRQLIGISRIGIGTSTPGLDLQITNGNTPAIRLEQTNGGGFTAQTWDIGANEANFFVRDLTNGSLLPFRIRPGAPTNSITAAANGNIGLGTIDPAARLHVFGAAGADTFANFGPSPTAGSAGLATAAGSQGFNVGYGAATLGAGTGFLNAFSTTGNAGRIALATDGTTRVLTDSNGNVGIGTGTTAPVAQLTTTGTVRFGGLASCGNGLISNASGDLSCGPASLVQQSAAGQPITVGAATDGSSVNFTGTAGTRKLTGVSAGTLSSSSTDAVNGSQLFATNSNVASLQNQIGNGTVGLVQQNPTTRAITVGSATDGTSVDFTGTAGTRTLTGVSAGAITSSSTDAINGSQLMTANQRVAMAFGGGAGLDANGQLTAPSYAIQGATYNNVGGALGALDRQVTTNTSNIATNTSNINNLQTQVSNGSIGLVQQNPSTRTITVGAATDGTVVDVTGTSGTRTVTGITGGALTAASTDAVNGSQLFATNQQVATNTAGLAGLSSVVAGLQGGGSAYFRSNSTGSVASATGTNASAIGSGSSASGANSLALGTNSQATQSGAIAIGFNAASTGTDAIAIGTGAVATGSVAVGAAASAANGGAAFGDGARATASNSTAIGPNSSATAANSVSIGSGSTNTQANTVSVGSAGNERRITNVAAGVSQSDAVNVGQLQSVASGFQSQADRLQNQVSYNRAEARDGIAIALAAGGSPALLPGRKFALGSDPFLLNRRGIPRGGFL